MAEEIGALKVSLSLDSADFSRSMASVDRNLKTLGQEMRISQSRGKEWGNSITGLSTKQDGLSRMLTAQELKVRKLNEAYQKSKEETGENSKQTENLATRLNRAQAEYARTETELNSVREALRRQQDELRLAENGWTKLGEKMQKIGATMKKVGDGMKNVGKELSMKVTAPIVAIGTLSAKAAIDFESAFAGVRKTVDASEEGFAKLEQGIRDMAKELPASAIDIAAVAESAGQLGIAEDKILSFSRTIIDLGESTNMTREQAATEFARFANIVGMSQDEFDRLGSSIVGLGNTMATTESEIMSMGMRLAAQGAQVGMTEAQIMALGGTMSSLGIQAEMGGTAMTTILKKIDKAVGDGGKGLKAFSDAAGVSSEVFSKAWEGDPITALDMFVKGLDKSSQEGKNLTTILADLGIKGVYESDVLLRMAGASDLLSEAVATSSTAWKENTALTNEAAERYETTASKLQMFKNKITDIGITLGNILIPVLLQVVEAIEPWISKFAEMSEGTQKAILVIAGIAAAIGPVLVVIGTLVSSIGAIVGAFGTVSAAIAVVTTGVASAVPAVSALATVFTVLTGPVGLAIAAVAAIGIGIGLLVNDLRKDAIPEVDRFGKGVSEATQEAVGGFMDMTEQANTALKGLVWGQEEVTKELAQSMKDAQAEITNTLLEAIGERHNAELEATKEQFANIESLSEEQKAAVLERTNQRFDAEAANVEVGTARINEIYQLAAEEGRSISESESQEIIFIRENMTEQAVQVMSESAEEQRMIYERMKDNASTLSALEAAEVVQNATQKKDDVVSEAENQFTETRLWAEQQRDELGTLSAEEAEMVILEAEKKRDDSIAAATETHEKVVAEAQSQAEEHIELVDWETGEILSKWDVFVNDVKKFMSDLGAAMAESGKAMWTATSEWFKKIYATVTEETKAAWTSAVQYFEKMVADGKTKFSELVTTTVQKFNEVKTKIEEKLTEAVTLVSTKIGEMPGKVREKVSEMVTAGGELIAGVIKGITGKVGEGLEAIGSFAKSLVARFKRDTETKSPSRAFEKVAVWFAPGVARGIEKTSRVAVGAMSDLSDKLTTVMHDLNNSLLDISDHHAAEEKKIITKKNADVSQIEKRAAEDVAKIQNAAHKKKRKTTQEENIKIRRIQEDAAKKIDNIEKKATSDSVKLIESTGKEKLKQIKMFIDEKKSMEQLTLVEEALIWEESAKLFEEGTKERVDAQKSYQKAVEAVNKEIVSINKEHESQMQKINDDLIKQVDDLNKAYDDSLKKRTQSLQNFKGVFDSFDWGDGPTGQELMDNLQTQIDGFELWQQEIDKISSKAIDEGLIAELREMGPKALPELLALNELTDEQLTKYSDMYADKMRKAREQSEAEHVEMRLETEDKISELRKAANKKLDELQKDWLKAIRKINQTTSDEFKSLNSIGKQAGQNLLDGLTSMEGALIAKARAIAAAVNAAMSSAIGGSVDMPSTASMNGSSPAFGGSSTTNDNSKSVVNNVTIETNETNAVKEAERMLKRMAFQL